jgi:hypothetical protein
LWGVWGLLLGAPILMAIKAVCDRVDDLKPIGELLGGIESAKIAEPACDSEQTSVADTRNMQT